MQLDELDARILDALHEDARRSFRELADLVGTSTPTVSARVKRMEELGIIQGYRVALSRRLLGVRRHVLRVRARPADLPAVGEQVAAIPGVEEVLVLAGGVLEARVHVAPDDDVARVLAAVAELPQVTEYEERRILDDGVVHVAPRPADARAGLEVDVRCHACKGPVHGAGVRKRLGDREHVFCCRVCLSEFEKRYARHQPPQGKA